MPTPFIHPADCRCPRCMPRRPAEIRAALIATAILALAAAAHWLGTLSFWS